MNNVGWIVPTHPPRENNFKVLLNSFQKFSINVDLIIVWTRKKDNFLPSESKVKSIFLDDYFSPADLELFEKTRSIINVKKIFGIMHEYGNYEGLFCTDDEIEFIRKFDGKILLEKFMNKNYFAATDISSVKSKENIIQRILAESCKFISDEGSRKLIKTATKDYKLFGWFADIPFYNSKLVPDFLSKFGLNDYQSLTSLSFFTFDHILYQYYLVLRGDSNYYELKWQYNNPSAYNWFECLHLQPLNVSYIEEYQQIFSPSWASSIELTTYFTESICIFHTDRVNLRFSRYLAMKHHLKSLVLSIFPKLENVF